MILLSCGVARSAPFFAVDFNDLNPDGPANVAPPSPTEGSGSAGGVTFRSFNVPHTNWPGTLAQRYTGVDPSASSGALTVWVGELNLGGFFDPEGDLAAVTSPSLQSRDRATIPPDGTPLGFTYSELYRDFASGVFAQAGNAPLAMEVSGLLADTDYLVTLYAYDHNNSRSSLANRVTFTDITPGSSGASATVASTLLPPQHNLDYATTLTVTSEAAGRIFIRSDANFNANHGILNGFEIAVVPEPSLAAIAVGLIALVACRRQSRGGGGAAAAARCASALSLLVALTLTSDAHAVTYLFDAPIGGANTPQPFSLWVPTHAQEVRGLIFMLPGSGGDYRTSVTRPLYQEAAGSLGFGLVGARDIYWGNSPEDAEAAIQNTLDAAAAVSGHPELSEAPIAVQGFSLGGYNAGWLAAQAPDYVISFVSNKYSYSAPSSLSEQARRVPGLFIAGENDSTIPPAVVRSHFDQWRSQNAQVAFGIDWRTGHVDTGNQTAEAAWFWLGESIRLRYGNGMTRQDLVNLDTAGGWLGRANNVSPLDPDPFMAIAPTSSYGGDPLSASWLPNEAAARMYRAFTSEDRANHGSISPLQGPLRLVSPAFDKSAVSPAGFELLAPFLIQIDPRDFANVSHIELYDGEEFLGLATQQGTLWELPYVPTRVGVHALTAVGIDATGRQTSSFRTFVIVPEPAALVVLLPGAAVMMMRRRG